MAERHCAIECAINSRKKSSTAFDTEVDTGSKAQTLGCVGTHGNLSGRRSPISITDLSSSNPVTHSIYMSLIATAFDFLECLHIKGNSKIKLSKIQPSFEN